MSKPETIMIDEVQYVRADSVKGKVVKVDGMDYKIIRSENAGVFAGYLKSRDGDEVVLRDARRLWYWSGAASLSQLSVDGVANPDSCKFPTKVDEITILGVIEIINCTQKAKDSIDSVEVWKS